MPATVSQKLASMIGMSVNTFCDLQASSKPRQFRTEAGRSRARVIRPPSSSDTQASASPREDSAQPRPERSGLPGGPVLLMVPSGRSAQPGPAPASMTRVVPAPTARG